MKLRATVLLRVALWGTLTMCLTRFVARGRPHQRYILGELVEVHEVLDGGQGLWKLGSTLIIGDFLLQELCYDYGYAVDNAVQADGTIKKMPCYCGAAECRKQMF